MSKLEMLYFGTIAAFVLLSWLNTYLRRLRRERWMRYYAAPSPVHRILPAPPVRHKMASVLILGVMLLVAAIGMVKVKERYAHSEGPSRDPTMNAPAAGQKVKAPDNSDAFLTTVYQDEKALSKNITSEPPATNTTADLPEGSEQLNSTANTYGIQTAALTDPEGALKLLEKVKAQLPEWEVKVRTSPRDGVLYYRIVLGAYPDERLARQALPEIRRLYPGSFPIHLDHLQILP